MNHNETRISSLCLGSKTRGELDTKIKQETELNERGKNKRDFGAEDTWKLAFCYWADPISCWSWSSLGLVCCFLPSVALQSSTGAGTLRLSVTSPIHTALSVRETCANTPPHHLCESYRWGEEGQFCSGSDPPPEVVSEQQQRQAGICGNG